MSSPEQEQALTTISALAESMRSHTLSDVQNDLLEIAERLMTNIAVQSAMKASIPVPVAPEVVEFEIGETVNIETPPTPERASYWQRTTVIDKVRGGLGYEYQTAFSGRGMWVNPLRLQKVRQ